MKQLFEIEWLGGAAEHHFRKARPGIDELPWGTIDTSRYDPHVLDAARATWTDSALTEYRAVAAFSDVMRALCDTGAPLDLIGMAAGLVQDEAVHVELASRMAMELGGAVPRTVDLDRIYPRIDTTLTPFQRANETVMRVSCIAEAFSGHMVVAAMKSTTHPLTRAVLERIAADESLHYRLGGLYFEWAGDQLDDAERERLGGVALKTLRSLAPSFRARRNESSPRYRAPIEQIREIGWIETHAFGRHVARAVRDAIVSPLGNYGIAVDPHAVDELLAA